LDGHEHSHSEHPHHEGHYGHVGGKKVPAMAVFAIVALVCLVVGYFAHAAFAPAATCQANNSTDVCAAPTSVPSGAGLTAAQLTALKADMSKYLTVVIAINGAPEGVTVEVKNITKDNDMYKAFYDIMQDGVSAQSGSGYVTADGKRLFLGTYMDLTEKLEMPTPKPAININVSGRPYKGAGDGSVTVVEFADFQCPACKAHYPTVEAAFSKSNGSVRFYLIHFPLSFHPFAQKAAEAFECAAKQGKEWDMYSVLFTKGSGDGTGLAVADLKGYAKDLALDTVDFNACLDGNKTAATVNADALYSEQLGVSATPTFFVNGKEVSGSSSGLAAAIEAALNE